MAKQVVKGAVLEGIISARVYKDGSLTIEVRRSGTGKRWSFEDVVELSPEGVKVLRALLVRDAQLRIGADDAGHSEACPAGNHALWASAPDPCKFCPDCGERLLS